MSGNPPVLVLGASGFVGANVVRALVADGQRPRCAHRRRTPGLALRKLGGPIDPVRVDVDDPAALVEAMRGCRAVIHSAGHYPATSRHRDETLALGIRQLEAVLDAAVSAGVGRVTYVSTIATTAAAPADQLSTEADVYAEAPGFGVYHDLKWAMERRALAEDRLEVRMVCPGACLGPWDMKVGTSALLVGLARGMDPPHPDGWVNLVDVRDVATAVVRMTDLPSAPRRLLLAGQNARLHALMAKLARRYGVAPPRVPLSGVEAVRLADAEEALAEQNGGRPAIVREIVDLVVHGVPVDCSRAEQVLGLRWTPLEDTLDAWETWARSVRILPQLEPTT